MHAVLRPLARLLGLHDASPAERRAVGWTAIAFFCVLFSYYLLRPLRENVGSAFGQSDLVWLFALTFVLTTALNQPYVALVRRLPSHRFLPYALHAFAASFVVLAVAFAFRDGPLGKLGWADWSGRGYAFFYSWVTAFSVCGVTLVWVHAVEWFSMRQGKRLFGLVSVGGTLGAMLGSLLSKSFASWSYPYVLVVAAIGVELTVIAWAISLRHCRAMAPDHARATKHSAGANVSFVAGVLHVLRTPYLRGIAVFVVIATVAATTFYYQRIALSRELLPDEAMRRSVEADINFWQNALSLVVQLVLTSRLLLWCGIGVALCAMPIASVLGLTVIGVWPAVAVYSVVEVLRRMLQFALDKPAREVLYTALDRQDKYVSKAVIDTSVLRGGDLLGAITNDLLTRSRVAGPTLALVMTPLVVVWAAVGWWLGRRCRRYELERGAAREPSIS